MKRKLCGAKRLVSALLSVTLLLSVLPTNILAADETRSTTDNVIINGSFEQPIFTDRKAPQVAAGTVDGWSTTASDQLIEFGSARKDGTVPHIDGSPNIPDGYQFAELNAKEESTLYQYTETVGGNVYEWGLSHRGRGGTDQMALIIGPKQTTDPAKPSADGKDQFMQMTDWVKNNAAQMGVSIPATGCTQKVTVYSKPFAENGGFADNADGVPFSKTPSNVYTQEWNVWIIGTSNNAWGNYGTNDPAYTAGQLAYSCRYAVPDGQSETIFAFCAYSAAGGKTSGNLLDAISFKLFQRLSISASGGKGELSISADHEDYTYKVENGESQEALAANGSTVTLRAEEPDENTTFVGAYITYQNLDGTLTREFIAAEQ